MKSEKKLSSWELKQRLKNFLATEKNFALFPNQNERIRFALCYPNSYYVGMSNLGFHIIYRILNDRDDTACERFFLPSDSEQNDYQRTKTPLLSLETQTDLKEFSLIGFAISFELDYFHMLKMLELGHVSIFSEERLNDEKAPIIVAGGPCATFNPEPLSPFVDVFVIGEGEEIMMNLMDVYRDAKLSGKNKRELLEELSNVAGLYVPLFKKKIKRQWVKNLEASPAHTQIISPNGSTEFNLYLIETARGCGRHCRFCMAGYCFRKPRRRKLDTLKKMIDDAKSFGKKIGFMGAAISDYPEIDELCDYVLENKMRLSVASFRADSVTKTLVNALKESGTQTLTIAPEAGSAHMRTIINKGISEEDVFKALHLGLEAGIFHFRFYFMIGLPFETDEDIAGIIDLTKRAQKILSSYKKSKLTLSINPFIPKPFTPFQWSAMASKDYIQKAMKKIRDELKKTGVEILSEPALLSRIQGVLARGDDHVGKILGKVHDTPKNFFKALNETEFDEHFYLDRQRDQQEIFPWSHLDMGLRENYLWQEFQKAQNLLSTEPCQFDYNFCKRCGVCEDILK